ncbi:MAG: hypothetical protein M1812_001880 [Candelaria pacifica]|nr:MAG: hypothetical protein M1812_001880 [Candelaria pacifica]
MKSNLDLVNECDSFPYVTSGIKFYSFKHGDDTLGYMLPSVVQCLERLPAPNAWRIDHDTRNVRLINPKEPVNAPEMRSKAIAATAMRLKETDSFKVLRGWRDELYPVYGPKGELLFNIERSASPLFGVITYGVHMTAYVRTDAGLKIWVPRRAKKKQTYGGMLDNTVAGGIATGEPIFESLVREAEEEASFSDGMVREHAQACGVVTYFYVRDDRAGGETGLLQPECQYVYDLEVGQDVTPKPGDDEVEEFYLWKVEEVQAALRRGEFKPNCAIVLLDFFIRHGILTPQNEKDYIEIVARIHRRLDFPTA